MRRKKALRVPKDTAEPWVMKLKNELRELRINRL